MDVSITLSGSTSVYVQITEQIIAHVDSGRLAPNAQLEPEISLARKLGVSRMTVNKAYHDLARRGYVERFRSRGTFVRQRNEGDKIKGTLTFLHHSGGGNEVSPITMDHMRGFQKGASKAGYATRLEFFAGGEADWRAHMGGDGMAFFFNSLPPGLLPEMPAVFIMGWAERPCPIDWVHTDNHGGGRLAAEHLLALGHRRLACYMDVVYHAGILERVDGFRQSVDDAGVALAPGAVPGRDRLSTPERLADLLRQPDRPTAIFCTTDRAALRVMDIARDLGLEVPSDLSVMGFDKSFFHDLSPRPLTTVFSDRTRVGEQAAEALIERVEGRYVGPARDLVVPVSLWPGVTTAPCVSAEAGRRR